MNRAQAMALARKLWGEGAEVEERGALTAEEKARLPRPLSKEDRERVCTYRCSVGRRVVIAGVFAAFSVEGQGDTWEEAFTQYDRRQDDYRKVKRYTKKTRRLRKGCKPLWDA